MTIESFGGSFSLSVLIRSSFLSSSINKDSITALSLFIESSFSSTLIYKDSITSLSFFIESSLLLLQVSNASIFSA